MTSDDRQRQRASEIFEIATMSLVVDLGVSAHEAACILVREASRVLTPQALRTAAMET